MTSPEPSATRPLRVAGLALLGVAAIALVIGLVSMFGGNGDDQADGGNDGQPPATTSSSAGSTGSVTPPSSGSGSTSLAPTTTTTTTTTPPSRPPGTNVPVPPGGDGNGESGKTEPVRVYNNSTISGLATRAADELRESGWTVAEVGNYPSGVIPTTTVYFRPGTAEESAAELLGDEFGMRVEPRFTGLSGFDPGLIVIVTNDYQGPGGDREPTEKNDK
ncbi:MAG TPA: LytR C-terminal domain-containing protein [Actinophytocola sp.]|nr:LytR C-terminal domain-containing protein [Actinophytocola sp.]